MNAVQDSQENGVNAPKTELTAKKPSVSQDVRQLRIDNQELTGSYNCALQEVERLQKQVLMHKCFLAEHGMASEFEAFQPAFGFEAWKELWNDKYEDMYENNVRSASKRDDWMDHEIFGLITEARDLFANYELSEITSVLSEMSISYQVNEFESDKNTDAEDLRWQMRECKQKSIVTLALTRFLSKTEGYSSRITEFNSKNGFLKEKFPAAWTNRMNY